MLTPDSIKSNTSLLDMENYVLQAEQHGGGWVPLVMQAAWAYEHNTRHSASDHYDIVVTQPSSPRPVNIGLPPGFCAAVYTHARDVALVARESPLI